MFKIISKKEYERLDSLIVKLTYELDETEKELQKVQTDRDITESILKQCKDTCWKK